MMSLNFGCHFVPYLEIKPNIKFVQMTFCGASFWRPIYGKANFRKEFCVEGKLRVKMEAICPQKLVKRNCKEN